MRFLTCFCLLMLGAARLPAAPAAANLVPVSWPDQGPSRAVGDPGIRVVQMPVPMVETLQRALRENPAKWEIIRLGDIPGRRGFLLEVNSRYDGLDLLFEQGCWTNLCAPAAVPFLNDAVRTRRPADLQDEEKLEKYLSKIITLHYGSALLLTKYFEHRRLTADRISYWLGSERRPEALLALCQDPVVTKNQHRVTVQCNMLLGDGSVQRCAFHLRVDEVVHLEAIATVSLRKKGSFSYALVIA